MITLRELTIEILRERERLARQRAFIASVGGEIRPGESGDEATLRIRRERRSLPGLMSEIATCVDLLRRIG